MGFTPHVYITNRQIVAGVIMFPLPYFLERNMRPSITVTLFLEILEWSSLHVWPGAWTVGLNIDLWCIIYTGIVCSALIIYIQLWCTEEKGPVFVTMFNPLSAILVAVLAYFVFGQKLYMGSILGGAIVIVGLYSLLWEKEND